MMIKFKAALEAGILLGVKCGTAILLIGAALYLLAGDYSGVRQAARQGQQAYDALRKAEEAAQK